MKSNKDRRVAALRETLTQLDPDSIDRLYGLEPVWEPDHRGTAPFVLEEFVPFACPWCGERIETRIDLSTADDGLIEDCQVCCRPMELRVERDEQGGFVALQVRRLD